MRSRRHSRGFTLLEVMVALAILAVSLVAVLGINGGTVRSHAYAKRLTVATMLARSKMVDIETHFFHEGFTSDFDQTMEGDFSEEGWKDFRWRAEIVVPDVDPSMATTLVTRLGEELLGGFEDEQEEASRASRMGGPEVDMRQATSGFEGMIQGQITQIVETLKTSLREVRLEVSWKDGNREETLDVVTHLLIPGGAAYAGGGPEGGNVPPAQPGGNQQNQPGNRQPPNQPGGNPGSGMAPGGRIP